MLKVNRKCRWCGAGFEKQRPMQVVCSPKCAVAYSIKQRERKTKQEKAAKQRKENALTRLRKRELETYPQLVKKAQYAFNAFIRARDKGKPCISCFNPLPSKPNGYDAGHYRSVGAAPHLRFNENNCHGQCKHCNRWLTGNHVQYRIGLISRIGQNALEELEADNEPKHYTKDDLRDLEKYYKKKRASYDREI